MASKLGIGVLGMDNISFRSGMRYVYRFGGETFFGSKPTTIGNLKRPGVPQHNVLSFWTMQGKAAIQPSSECPLYVDLYTRTGELLETWTIGDIQSVVCYDSTSDPDWGTRRQYDVHFSHWGYEDKCGWGHKQC